MKALPKSALALLEEKSTIVRSINFQKRATGIVWELAGTLAPQKISKFLMRQFTTTERFEAPAEEKAVLAQAHAFQVPFGDQFIQAWSWGDGPTILLVHGWNGRGGQFHAFVEPLL